MAIWKKQPLIQAFNKVIFSEEFGFGLAPKMSAENFVFFVGESEYSTSDLFVKNKDGKFTRADCVLDELVKSSFNTPLYRNKSFIRNEFELIKPSSLVLTVPVAVINDFDDIKFKYADLRKVVISKKYDLSEGLNKHLFFCFDETASEGIINISLNGGEGDSCYLLDNGLFEISKLIFDEKNELSGYEIKNKQGETKQVEFDSEQLVACPDTFNRIVQGEKYDFLKLKKNIEDFMFMGEKKPNGLGSLFMWHGDYTSYTYLIELFHVVETKYGPRLYKLNNEIIEENKYFYFVSNEEIKKIGDNVYIRLVVKTKKGKLVAFSKGINVSTFSFFA